MLEMPTQCQAVGLGCVTVDVLSSSMKLVVISRISYLESKEALSWKPRAQGMGLRWMETPIPFWVLTVIRPDILKYALAVHISNRAQEGKERALWWVKSRR